MTSYFNSQVVKDKLICGQCVHFTNYVYSLLSF